MNWDRLKQLSLVYWPVGLAALIMIPRVVWAEFGLFDDGETLRVADEIQNGNWSVIAKEGVFGRFRPIYWIQYFHIYALAGAKPTWFFLWNMLLFMTITALTIHIVRRMKGSNTQAAATGLFIVLAGPIIESTFTLSKPELLQSLLLLAAVTPFASPIGGLANRTLVTVWAAILILIATLTKETAAIMVPISAAWLLLALIGTDQEQRRAEASRWGALLAASLIATLAFFVLRNLFLDVSISEGNYSNNFEFTAARLVNSGVRWAGWLIRDFAWLVPLLLIPLADLIGRKMRHTRLVVGALIWTLAWILIYQPWEFTIEYYMLPAAIGLSIIGGVAVESAMARIRERRRVVLAGLSLVLAAILWLITILSNYSNARQQLAVDIANARMLEYVAQRGDEVKDLVVNIQLENEYIYEIRTFLQDVKHLDEASVEVFNPAAGFPPGPLLIASPYIRNQPLLAVRMGVVETTQSEWNQSFAETLDVQGDEAFEWEENFRLTIVDLPRLLCAALPQRGYCASDRPLVDTREFQYGWQIYELPESSGN